MGDKLFEITAAPISVDEVSRRVADPAAGCVVSFAGLVRGDNQGRQVRYLEYEAYPEMAEPILAQIGAEAQARWPVDKVAIVHRVGRLEIGEASVVVAVASPHRAEAFAACRFAIDALKAQVPIWKKELYADGSEWLDGTPAPRP